jgi:hypothetical protein
MASAQRWANGIIQTLTRLRQQSGFFFGARANPEDFADKDLLQHIDWR